jgi:release factor glutamine methyltransferase
VAHGVADVVGFTLADLTDVGGSPDSTHLAGPADLLVANLPYIPTAVVPTLPVAASFEPRLALDGGADGLAVIRRLLTQLPDALGPDGMAMIEIGAEQGEALGEAVAAALPGWSLHIHNDLAGRPRVAELSRGSGA